MTSVIGQVDRMKGDRPDTAPLSHPTLTPSPLGKKYKPLDLRPLALVDFDFHFCKYHFWHTRGPGSLLRRPAGGLKLEAGLQPGAQQVAGEAGHAGGILRVLGCSVGGRSCLGRPDVYSLGAGGITCVTACSVSEMDPSLRIARGWGAQGNQGEVLQGDQVLDNRQVRTLV